MAGTLVLLAQDITSVFLNIPESVLFGVDAENKDKLIAKQTDTTTVSVISPLNGVVKRLQLTDDFIALQTSDAGTLQIKLLPLVNDSKIICVVNTVCGKACDSHIRFFNTNWTPLTDTGILFSEPAKDWFIKSDADRSDQNFVNAYIALDMIPQKIVLGAHDLSLTVYCDIENYLSAGDYKNIKPYLSELSKVYKWDKISFK